MIDMLKFPYLLLLVFFAVSLSHAQQERPNILFIYTDDQASWALGASGDPNAHTPHLDRLVTEGAYLKNAFVTTPVCSPARAALMTSQYASEYGIYDFIPQPGHRLYDPEVEKGLSPESVTFAEILQQAGYTTGLVGKWHLGDWTQTDDKKYHPTNHGFDYFMGLTGGGTSPDNPTLEENGAVREFEGLTTNILTDHALEFIADNLGSPFLLCLHYRAPHGRWLPVAEEDWSPYVDMDPILPNPFYPDLDKEKAKRRMQEYLASTSGVDRSVGRIMRHLEELGISENTIVIFTSDHGYNMGHNGIEHKGNGIWITRSIPPATEYIASKYRPNLYDNSLKVPAIVRWPGKIQPGITIERTTSNLDWYPTIIEMAGAELPEGEIIRGNSLLPLLKGEEVPGRDDDFYAEYSMVNYCKAYMRCYRTPEWKLVRDFLNPERDELYHIALDPQENINLINDCRPEVKAIKNVLDEKLKARMMELNDPVLKGIFPE